MSVFFLDVSFETRILIYIVFDYICQENDAKFLFNTYLDRYLNFNYNKQLDEEFINNLNYEECLDLLRKIDFSNYSVITQNKM